MTDRGCEGCMFREHDSHGCICSLTDDYLSQMDECPLEEEGYRMPCPDDSVISVAPPVSVQNGEGGEKGMASEWEELEKLSKDELIIELVHWKTLYSLLRSEQDEGCRYPDLEVPCVIDDEGFWEPGQVTTDEWAEKISVHAAAHATGEDFYPSDLIYFGLTDIQAFRVCDKLRSESRLILPPGVRYYNPEEDI